MHERAILNDIMNKINELSSKDRATRVVKISVLLGALSHMTPDHFQEHFEEAAKGTIAEGAVVEAIQSSDIHAPHANGVIVQNIEVV